MVIKAPNNFAQLLKCIIFIIENKKNNADKIIDKFESNPAIVSFLRMIQKKIKDNYYSRNEIAEFVDKSTKLLLKYATNKYSSSLELTDDDLIDSLITSINFLGEELNYSTVTTHYTKDIFDSIGDMLLVVDKRGHILFINATISDKLAYKESELISKNINMILEPGINVENLLISKKKQIYVNFITSDNKSISVSLKISNFARKDNPMMGYVIIARDVTLLIKHQNEIEEKNRKILKVNKKLNEALKKAKESDKLKSAFLANVSHEIRTPLNGIMGFSQLMQDESFSPSEFAHFGSLIYKGGAQLLSIVSDILDISKIESGTLSLSNKTFFLNELLDDLYNIYKQKCSSLGKNIVLELHKSFDDENSIIKTDDIRLKQVLFNLLDNAVKFTQKGQISFGYTVNKKVITFFVKDTGIGIPEDKLNFIFKPFMQSDNSLTKEHGGTGLGLAIVKGLAKLMKGRIEVKSEIGIGSNFYFKIPLYDVKPIVKEKTETTKYSWKNKNILVVEDDPISISLCQYFFSKTEAEVKFLETGYDTLNYVLNPANKVDLILMDIKLPDIDGIAITKSIRKSNKSVTIIIQSAHTFPEDMFKCTDAGCNDYISKPLDQKLLFQKINSFFKEEVRI